MISAKRTVLVTMLALAAGCVTGTMGVPEVPARDSVWEYSVEVQYAPGYSFGSEHWRARIDRSGTATVEVLWGVWEWFPFQVVQLSDDQLDKIAAAIEEDDFWQLPERNAASVVPTDLATTVLTVGHRDGQHRVTFYAAFFGFSEEVDRSLRILLEILRVIPNPNDGRRPDPPASFGGVVAVDDDLLTILLSRDSPVLTEPGPSFAVYRDDEYQGEAVVVGIRGRVLSCRIRQQVVNIEVGDSAAVYLR